MTIADRFSGVRSGLALKAPVRVATTANLSSLAGLQTIDGVTLEADNRVLVKDQTDTVDNGIYLASTGNWTRAKDFDGVGDVVTGTRVYVYAGSTQAGEYNVTTTGTLTIGTTGLAFAATESAASTAIAAAASATAAADSATAAATAETNAETAETNAETAQAAAEAAQSAAETAQAAAEAAQSAAETAETNAAASETAAAASATTAASQAAALSGTSTTSLAIGTGTKTFTTQSGKSWSAGTRIFAFSDADPDNYMFGIVSSYSSTTLEVEVSAIGGSGTYADWTLRIGGDRGAQGIAGLGDLLDTAFDGWKKFTYNVGSSSDGAYTNDGHWQITTAGRYYCQMSLSDMGIEAPASGVKIVYLRFREIEKSGTFTSYMYVTTAIASGSFSTSGGYTFAAVPIEPTDTFIRIDLDGDTGAELTITVPEYACDGDGAMPSILAALFDDRAGRGLSNHWPLTANSVTGCTYTDGVYTVSVYSPVSTLNVTGLSLDLDVPYTLLLTPPDDAGLQYLKDMYIQLRNGGSTSSNYRVQRLPGGCWGTTFTPSISGQTVATSANLFAINTTPDEAGAYTPADVVFETIQLVSGTLYPVPTAASSADSTSYDPAQGVITQSSGYVKAKFKATDAAATRYFDVQFERQENAGLTRELWDIATIRAATRSGAVAFSDDGIMMKIGAKLFVFLESGAGDFMGPDPHRAATLDWASGSELWLRDGCVWVPDGSSDAYFSTLELVQRLALYKVEASPSTTVDTGTQRWDITSRVTIDAAARRIRHRLQGTCLSAHTLSAGYIACPDIYTYQAANASNPVLAGTAWLSAGDIVSADDLDEVDLTPGFGSNLSYPGQERMVVCSPAEDFSFQSEATSGFDHANRRIIVNSASGGTPAISSCRWYFDAFPNVSFGVSDTFDITVDWVLAMTR